MQSLFNPDFFITNRTKLRESMGTDTPIVVTGNGVMQRGGDEPSPFYQDSNFWYLTGLNGADLTLVMTAQETYVIVPQLSFVREAFDGAHDVQAYISRSGITTFLPERDGWKRLRNDLQQVAEVATLASPPLHIRSHGIYTLPYRRQLISRLKRMNAKLTIQDIRPQLAKLRCIKQPEELRALQRAIDVTTETLLEVTKPESLQKMHHEYEMEAAISYGFRRRGTEGHGFAPIIGAGKHTTQLHYMDNEAAIEPDDLIVLDIGASTEHYAADISRTVSQAPLTGRKAEVWSAVADVQDYALGLMKPGVLYPEYELAVEKYMGKQLVQLGLVSEANHENIRHYFPHATSHFLGLDVHDVGDYRAPWEPGMVLTCEPGIYIPEENIGVRLEDDVLITEAGHKVLSSACPRRLGAVQ